MGEGKNTEGGSFFGFTAAVIFRCFGFFQRAISLSYQNIQPFALFTLLFVRSCYLLLSTYLAANQHKYGENQSG